MGECVDISTGYPFDSQDFNENGEYLVITNGNIQENTPFVLNNVGNRIDLDDSLKKYILDIDDLLITMDGTVGRVAIVVDNKLVLAQRVCRIKSNEPYYIYQLLSKNDFIRSMNKIGHGGTIKHISLSEISEYQAFYPKSQKERIKISSVLTNYDELITLHQRKLEKLQATKKALLYELFPIENSRRPKRRFKGFTGDWEQRKLADVANIIMGQSPSSQNYTDNPNDNILVQGNADLIDGQVVPRLWTKKITKSIDAGNIVMTVRAPVGDVAKTAYKVVLGRGVAGIKGDEYIYQFLLKLKYNHYWRSLSSGSTFESINSNDIKNLIIDIPCDEERTKIRNLLSTTDTLITLHQEESFLHKYML